MKSDVTQTRRLPKYRQAAEYIENLINKGSLKPGDAIPSLRTLASTLGIGLNTVRDAYWDLERRGIIITLPQSGHYVRSREKALKPSTTAISHPTEVSLCRIYDQHVNRVKSGASAALSIVQLDSQLWPSWKSMVRWAGQLPGISEQRLLEYAMAPGLPVLQKALARQFSLWGLAVEPETILITGGCNEAISLTLGLLCKPGDVVVVESPLYFAFLSLLKHLDVQIIEIPNHPETGLNLDILEFVLSRQPVRAVLCSPNFSNPLGCLMPEDHKLRLIKLARQYNTLIVEDDIYGDLPHRGSRPKPLKAFDLEDRVIYCSSCSKTIAPGLRVGWIINKAYFDALAARKTMMNLASSTPSQAMLAGFLESRSYDRYLRRIRRIISGNCNAIRQVILREFPQGTAVSSPQGGLALWAELPREVDCGYLYDRAIREDILLAPGMLFTVNAGLSSCLRINIGVWNPRVEAVLIRVGALAREIAATTTGAH
ncbi:aminotransferase-like domain-containing protein [Spirochaeta lutea]|uniref:HTH gntR-type domain-containing protein n=1 Tax=Spirochaeta lutea TaxID=1480694 RepID=A0A098QTH0_9SPIO|nr:PLP-dependent aminotransferase family protein [Spirochaeta lutea]KGE70806.1 hypothetical protein DC28_15075 [Spirochaeta lutea]